MSVRRAGQPVSNKSRMTRPADRPVPAPFDVAEPLFDNHGNLHSVILCTMFQLLTTFRGLFFVWDRLSGESLMGQRSRDRISNDPLPVGAASRGVTSDDRLRMRQSSMIIDCLRRSSRAALAGRQKRRRIGDQERQ